MYHNHLLCIIHTSNTIMKMSIYTNIKHITTRETSYTWFNPSMKLRPPKLVSLYIILSREDLQCCGTSIAIFPYRKPLSQRDTFKISITLFVGRSSFMENLFTKKFSKLQNLQSFNCLSLK